MEHIIYRDRFIEAMDEDLNTPRALAVLFDLARDINRESSSGLGVIKAQKTLAELSGVLGLTLSDQNSCSSGDIAPFVEMLITVRSELREVKQFDLADNIREKLLQLGISLEDTEEGTIWRFS
jgi:cysteinyl-tRNA synthetase